jgi:hypothetical protein
LAANLIRESFTFSGLNNSRDRIGKVPAARIAATILVFIIDERCSWQKSKNQLSALQAEIAVRCSQSIREHLELLGPAAQDLRNDLRKINKLAKSLIIYH